MQYLIILCLISVKSMDIQTTTASHWIVTHTGFIKPKLASPFQMENPNDLLAFLNQDIRWNNINNLYHDLYKRQSIINKQWAEIEKGDYARPYSNTPCGKIRVLNALNWYYGELEDGTSKLIPKEEYFFIAPSYGEDVLVPDCRKISPLTHSMFTFKNLNGTSGRVNLKFDSEKKLPKRISSIMSVQEFGHWLATVLTKNSSSWLHYNMASLYWRVKGNAHKTMDCSRRAVHYAPTQYRDIALLNMGMILHQSKRTEDAIKVLSAAIEHDPNFYLSHFILANALAVYGDYNTSLKHYDLSKSLNPKFTKVEKYKDEMLCCASWTKRIVPVRGTVVELRKNLKEYLQREDYMIKSLPAFLKTMQHDMEHGMVTDYFTKKMLGRLNINTNCEKMTELTELNIRGLKSQGQKYALIHYFIESSTYNNEWINENGVHIVQSALSLYVVVKHIHKNANKKFEFIVTGKGFKITDGTITEEIGSMPLFENIDVVVDNSNKKKEEVPASKAKEVNNAISEFETGVVIYSPAMRVNRNREDFDKDPDWPPIKFCKDYPSVNLDKVEGIYPVFLPFENKGVRLRFILTDKIGIPITEVHDLPWHPPICTNSNDDNLPIQKKNPKNLLLNAVIATDYLNKKLLEYVGDGDPESVKHLQEAEIGQRIFSATQKHVAPPWILFTLSSLYWRVRGNNINALSCLLQAIKVVDNPYKDIVLTSMASVYLEMGYFDESLSAAEKAFKLNMYEPATNFILAELNMLKKHGTTQLLHLKQVVRVDPDFMDGLARNLLNSWACINEFSRHANIMKELDFIEKEACSGDKYINVPCNSEDGGVNCEPTKCYTASEKGMSSVVKTLEENTADDKLIDDNIFSSITNNMPTQRSDKGGHEMNYEDLLRRADYAMMGCGPQGCRSMTAEDLALKRSDCLMQYMQLGYWLQIVGFRHTIEDPNLRLPADVESVTPSNANKVPDCRLLTDPATDFFLGRMMRVDTEGWKPDLTLMHQFIDVYDYSDYVTLGAKLAKYLSEHPQSWRVMLTAGWWCGVSGRGACAVRCFAAAFSLAPKHIAMYAPRSLSALLTMHSKLRDAKDMAYLAFYIAPTNKQGALIAAISHSVMNEYDQAVWMLRYTMKLDSQYLAAKVCLHATMCHMIYPELTKDKI